MEELLQFICGALEERGIDYMLSGSVAMGAYTVARYTRDIDVVIELAENQLDSFADVFADPAKFYFHRPSVEEEEVRRRGIFNVISQTSTLSLRKKRLSSDLSLVADDLDKFGVLTVG